MDKAQQVDKAELQKLQKQMMEREQKLNSLQQELVELEGGD